MISTSISQSDVLDPRTIERLRRIGGTTLLRQLVDLFLGKAQHNLETLSDTETLAGPGGKLAAHALVATAGNLGATRLSKLAQDLEVNLAAADKHQVRLLQPLVLAELERTVVELTRLRTALTGGADEEDRHRRRQPR